HLYPMIALVFLTLGILLLMAKRRFAAMKRGQVSPNYFKLYKDDSNVPDEILVLSRSYINQFELPILFYLLIIVLILTDRADQTSLLFSWLFVITRYIHTIIHITKNKLILRMRAFVAGFFILILLWGRLLWQLLELY